MVLAKDLPKRNNLFTSGHRLCAGCPIPIITKMLFMASDWPIVVANATGCLEVATTIYPFTSWNTPWIHSAFENAAATISGVEAMYQSLKKQGKIDKKIKFVAFGGDGGSYDIGVQALSGAIERGHDFTYICYDNGAYMNTGIQRSGATPYGAATTTSPAGSLIPGKPQKRKDLTFIVAGHHIGYAAQAAVHKWQDLHDKIRKSLEFEGPAFINVLSPCIPGWGYPENKSVEISKMATETNSWPLFEIENGIVKINYRPKEVKPVTEYTKLQARFRHLHKDSNKAVLENLQKQVDEYWEFLNSVDGKRIV